MAADCSLSVSSDADKSQSRIVSINKAVSVIMVECRLVNCQDVFYKHWAREVYSRASGDINGSVLQIRAHCRP